MADGRKPDEADTEGGEQQCTVDDAGRLTRRAVTFNS